MRVRAGQLVPDPGGVLKGSTASFRRGRSGSGRELLTDDEMRRYYAATAELAPLDLLGWLHDDFREPA